MSDFCFFDNRCPLCNNDKRFISEMKQFGIYIPEGDSAWEESSQSSTSTEKRPECRALICFCQNEGPDHRFHDSDSDSWQILGCHSCGFKGIHARCGGMVNCLTDSSLEKKLFFTLKSITDNS